MKNREDDLRIASACHSRDGRRREIAQATYTLNKTEKDDAFDAEEFGKGFVRLEFRLQALIHVHNFEKSHPNRNRFNDG